jgi:hypothetical protein
VDGFGYWTDLGTSAVGHFVENLIVPDPDQKGPDGRKKRKRGGERKGKEREKKGKRKVEEDVGAMIKEAGIQSELNVSENYVILPVIRAASGVCQSKR